MQLQYAYLDLTSQQEVNDFFAESAIMLDFDHPNVMRLVGVCFDTEDKLPLIILPYKANGDLRTFLRSKRLLNKGSNSMDVENYPQVHLQSRFNIYNVAASLSVYSCFHFITCF